MLSHIQTHKDNLREQVRYRKKLGNYKLLIIDEWLNYKINERESRFIYGLIEHRCGNNPTIFVGQYGISDWHERLGGGTQADSIMDRIIHNSYEFPTSDNNLRKLYDPKKAQRVIDSLRHRFRIYFVFLALPIFRILPSFTIAPRTASTVVGLMSGWILQISDLGIAVRLPGRVASTRAFFVIRFLWTIANRLSSSL